MWSDRFIGGMPVERWLGDQVFRSRLEDRTPVVVRMLEGFQILGRTDEERTRHFQQRVRGWGAVQTPGVIDLVEGRYDPLSDSFLVISGHVAGTDLAQLRKRNGRPFGPEEVAELLVPALRLLQDLHDQGMNHNRLRASSLVLRRTLAMVDDPFVLVDLDCTDRPPPLARSSAFFHPRQPGDWRANDVYGMAAIAWYLTRSSPRVPPRPAHQVLAETTALGNDWDRFLRHTLHPDPARRPADASGLSEQLARFLPTPDVQSARAL